MLKWKQIHFTGIGGAGMSSIANLLLQRGVDITGSDLEDNKNVRKLLRAGAIVSIGHTDFICNNTDLLVYSSAVPEDNPERIAARGMGIPEIRRGVFLAELASLYPKVIAVGGSHGKTTVTAMLAHIFRECGAEPDFIIGGTPSGNLPFSEHGNGKILITEADESDCTLAEIKATTGVIINVEDDHSWSAGGSEKLFNAFREFSTKADKLIFGRGEIADEIFKDHPNSIPLSIDKDLCDVPQPGRHNRHNAAIALRAAADNELVETEVKRALQSFKGVKRRCSVLSTGSKHLLIEDYAHHPTELKEFTDTLFDAYPEKRKVIIFQPHRFERVENYGSEFAAILKRCDSIFITPPFSAWHSERKHSTANIAEEAGASYLENGTWEEYAAEVMASVPPEEDTVYAVVGAASVEKIIPWLRNSLREHEINSLIPSLETHTNLSWGDLTTLSIGFHNPLVVSPETESDLAALLEYSWDNHIKLLPLGCGSNMVGGDEPYDGIIVHMKKGFFSKIEVEGNRVIAGAGLRLSRFVNILADNSLGGGEALISIPGSVGGAIRMNAGAQGIETCDFITSIKGIHLNGQLWSSKGSDINWHYRGSDIPADVIITEAVFQFEAADSAAAKDKIASSRTFRKDTQPGGKNPGCAFRNPGNDSAGRLIDKLGLKNLKKGNCIVSDIHANFIVNEGGGGENDYAWLLEEIQKIVFQNCGIVLENEVVFSNGRKIHGVNPLNITVLKGGPSPEREISLISGAAVAGALRDGGNTVTELDVTEKALPEIPADCDVIFPVLHGEFGEDGDVQTLLDATGIPYVGTGAQASKITIDKFATANLLRKSGIDTPASQILSSDNSKFEPVTSFPVIVKPNSQGSTIGMTIVQSADEIPAAVDKAFEVDTHVIIEEYINGQEVTCGLLYGEALPVVEIIPPDGFFDFDAKYTYSKGKTIYNCPPEHIPDDIQKRMQDISGKCFSICNARHLLRVDMIWRPEDDRIVVLEVNTLPGFTASSLMPKSAKVAGYSFTELCCLLAVKAFQEK